MERFITNDQVPIMYWDIGSKSAQPMVLIHGWTGSSAVFKRNFSSLSKQYRVIAPDLRGHGYSDKGLGGHHVSRLAMDLKELFDHLQLPDGNIIGIGASLGCAVLWSFAELFTASAFWRLIFVDQAPLQNYAADGSWGAEYGSRGCNSASSLAHLQATLHHAPQEAYLATVNSCLAYRSHPLPTDKVSQQHRRLDEDFFMAIAMAGDSKFYGALMADHTALDWRESIAHSFSRPTAKNIQALIIASDRSGCFPAKGPLAVVDLVNAGRKKCQMTFWEGIIVSWGGHWCYWEKPEEFNNLILAFLNKEALNSFGQLYY